MQKIYFYIVFLSTPCAYAAAGGGGAASGDSVRSSREHAYQYSTDPEGTGDNHELVIGAGPEDYDFRAKVQGYVHDVCTNPIELKTKREAFKPEMSTYMTNRILNRYKEGYYTKHSFDDSGDFHGLWDSVEQELFEPFEEHIASKKDIDSDQENLLVEDFIKKTKCIVYDDVCGFRLMKLQNKYGEIYPGHYGEWEMYNCIPYLFCRLDRFLRKMPLDKREIDIATEYFFMAFGYCEKCWDRRKALDAFHPFCTDVINMFEESGVDTQAHPDVQNAKMYLEKSKVAAAINIQKIVRGYLVRKKSETVE